MSIVVVDDEPELLELVGDVLREAGYHVLGFAHPAPVIQLQQSEADPDLFLIDLMLPDIDGITLARRLREAAFPTTPMVAISASRRLLHQAHASGLFQSTLRKPFDLDTLLACVEHHASAAAHLPGQDDA